MPVSLQLTESPHSHGRVAFPLPHVPLTFRWVRPKAFPDNPKTLGEHLHKRRAVLGLIQAQAAEALGVSTWTYLLWETDRTTPTIRYYPAIFDFLGCDPFPEPTTLPERIAAQRRKLGLSIERASELVGVDESTFARWERGERHPGKLEKVLERFLAAPKSGFAGG